MFATVDFGEMCDWLCLRLVCHWLLSINRLWFFLVFFFAHANEDFYYHYEFHYGYEINVSICVFIRELHVKQ